MCGPNNCSAMLCVPVGKETKIGAIEVTKALVGGGIQPEKLLFLHLGAYFS